VTNKDDDEISIAQLIQIGRDLSRIIWDERLRVGTVIAMAVSIGLVISFGAQTEYTASTKILPYRLGGGVSGFSSLAGLAGVRLPQGAIDPTIPADLYPEVVKTLDFRAAVAETPIRFSSLPEPVTPMHYFREIAKPSMAETIAKYSIGLPRTMLSAIIQQQDPETLSVADSGRNIRRYDNAYLGVIDGLGDRIIATSDKKTGILLVSARMPDSYAAADLVRVASDHLMRRIIKYDSQKASEAFRFLDEEYQKAKDRYENAQRNLAEYSDRNRAQVSATAQINRDRLQREYDIAFEIYGQFSREREQARIKMNQDTPAFTILEQITVPNRKSSPRRWSILLISSFLGTLTALTILFIRRYLIQLEKTEGLKN
jgi:hypothetical protein